MTQKPVAWAVTACSKMFMGEFAELDAKAEARRCGGTCVSYALYAAPAVATDVLKDAERYRWLRDSELEPEDQEFPAIVMLDDFGSCPIARGDMDATIDKYMAKYPGVAE